MAGIDNMSASMLPCRALNVRDVGWLYNTVTGFVVYKTRKSDLFHRRNTKQHKAIQKYYCYFFYSCLGNKYAGYKYFLF
jgi:hypothetical protein